jgi:hypothetical protein
LYKQVFKALGFFFFAILLLFIGVYVYILVNKKSIINSASAQVSQKLNGKVQIGNIHLNFFTNFPSISLQLQNVSITDTMYTHHKHIFLEAKEIFLKLSLVNLLLKTDPVNGLNIDDASIYLFTDTSGYTNAYLLEPKKNPQADTTAQSGQELMLNRLKMKNVRITINNLQRERMIDFDIKKMVADIDSNDSLVDLSLENKIYIHQLGFNLAKGVYAKEKMLEGNFDLHFNRKQRLLWFNDIAMEIGGQDFTFSGKFQFNDNKKYNLTINTKSIDVAFARSLLTNKISEAVSIVSLTKPIDVQTSLIGTLKPGEPVVKVDWQVTDSDVQTPIVLFNNCTFIGSFTNLANKALPLGDSNSSIEIHNFDGSWEGIPLHSKNIYFLHFDSPLLICDLSSKFQLSTLNGLLQSSAIELKKGTGQLNITYKGPLNQTSNLTPVVNGNLTLMNGELRYAPRNITLENCKGTIQFANADVLVSNLYCEVANNKITMKGSAKQLLALIKAEPNKISLDWEISTPSLNLEAFTVLLQTRGKGVAIKKPGKFGRVANQLDNMLEQSNLNLTLHATEAKYQRFNGAALNASISMNKDSWLLNKISLKHAGGTMLISGDLHEKDNRYHQVHIKANLNNIDANKIMYAFDNFGQDGIVSENLRGKLTANANLTMNLDRNAKVASNMSGALDFSLKQGALVNYSPILKAQSFFGDRDFSNIQFAELKNRLTINDRDITINKMEIQSNVVTMFVEGVYSMKGNTNIYIQVPLKNLKKKHEVDKVENNGVDAKKGMSVYLHGTPGEDGKIKFTYGLFNKKKRGL